MFTGMFCWEYGSVVFGSQSCYLSLSCWHHVGVVGEVHLQGMSCWEHGNVVLGSQSCWHHVDVVGKVCSQGCSVGSMGMLCWVTELLPQLLASCRCCWRGVSTGMFCWEYGNVVLGSHSCWHHVGVI